MLTFDKFLQHHIFFKFNILFFFIFDELPLDQRSVLYRLNRENEFHQRHRSELKKTLSTTSTISTMSNSSSTVTNPLPPQLQTSKSQGSQNGVAGIFSSFLGIKSTSQDTQPSNMYSPLQTTEITSENRQVSTSSESATGNYRA